GFNAFLADQQKIETPAVLSLYQFDDHYEPNYEKAALSEAKPLNTETYVPRGSTALLDAIGRTINAVEARKPAKAVIVIITDGHENASREFSATKIKAMIDEKTAAGWSFVYLGANQDAITVASQYGIG